MGSASTDGRKYAHLIPRLKGIVKLADETIYERNFNFLGRNP